MKTLGINEIYNCILGGAIGDALGCPVNDMSYDRIIEQYGKNGLTDMEVDCDGKARITANTQLTIFTIDTIIRAYTKYYLYDITGLGKVISYTGFLRWQHNQGRKVPITRDRDALEDNYLMDVPELKYERFSEKNMLQVLENEMLEDDMANNNKGFACVTKAAPFGLAFYTDDSIAFEMAVKVAKLTHGHPTAYLSAGVVAVIIASIARGEKIDQAIDNAIKILKQNKDRGEVLDAISLACRLAKDEIQYPEKFDDFGDCNEAQEVLAAALYVCLVSPEDLKTALLFAVNNNCMGSNVATLVGQILGLYNGIDSQVMEWTKKMEVVDLFGDLASDFAYVIKEELPSEVENFDKEIPIENLKKLDKENIASWWLMKYDKD